MKKQLCTLLSVVILLFATFSTAVAFAEPDYGENGGYESCEGLIEIPGFEDLPDLKPLVVRYPKDKPGPNPTIIFLHGFGAGGAIIPGLTFGDTVYRSMTEHFVSRGYNVIAPAIPASINVVLAGLGMGYPYLANEVLWAGVEAGVAFLCTQGRIDKSRIGVVGHSLGGGVAPYITHKVAQHGWGDNGLFMAQLAPWYSHMMCDDDLRNLPGHTKYLGIVFKDDTTNSFRMAIDIYEHLAIDELEKDFLKYECPDDDHNLPAANETLEIIGLSPANDGDYFLWRHLDALAHYSFEGPYASAGTENAREVSLGVTPGGIVTEISRAIQETMDTNHWAKGTDDPIGEGFGSDGQDDKGGLSKWHGNLNLLGPLPTPFPIGPLLNPRWYMWDDYYEDGIKRNTVSHFLSYLIRPISPEIADLFMGFGDYFIQLRDSGGNPIALFDSKLGISLPKVVITPEICTPEICGPKYCYEVWVGPWPWDWKTKCRRDCIPEFCTPEVALGPVNFNPVDINVKLEKLSIGSINVGELLLDPGTLDLVLKDIEVAVKVHSDVLGINDIVEDILDFLGLGDELDALDGNFTSYIKVDRLELPIKFSLKQLDNGESLMTILPSLFSSDFKTEVDLPDAFNVFGFDLAQKVVDKITSEIDDARNFILQEVFNNIQGNVLSPIIDGLKVKDAVWEPLLIEPVVMTKIYWLDQDANVLNRCNMDGTNSETLVSGLTTPRSLAIYHEIGKMFWTDRNDNTIECADLDGSNQQTIVTGAAGPIGLAVDPSTGKIYWLEKYGGILVRCDIHGGNKEILITGLGDDIKEIELDITNGKMYWTEKFSNKIRRADLDGSNVEDVMTGMGNPIGLALDVSGGKLYWADGVSGKIRRADLDGTNAEDLFVGLNKIKYIDLDLTSRKIYWTSGGDDMIQTGNMDGSGTVSDLLAAGRVPFGIALGSDGPVISLQ